MKKVSKRPHQAAFLRKWWQLLVLVLAFSSVKAQSDAARYMSVNGYGFKYKRHATDSVQLIPLFESPHTPYRAGAIKYRTSDSSLYKWTGTQWLKVNESAVTTDGIDSIHIYAAADPDPDTLYQYNGGDSSFVGYLQKGGGGTPLDNIGAGYRWLLPGTQEFKTGFPGDGILIDSTSNTNGLTFKRDTTGANGTVTRSELKDSLNKTTIVRPPLRVLAGENPSVPDTIIVTYDGTTIDIDDDSALTAIGGPGPGGTDSVWVVNSGNDGERLGWTSAAGDTVYMKKLVAAPGISIVNQSDSSLLIGSDSTGFDSYWKTGGNNTSTAKKLGTTDNNDVILITNNIERGRLKSGGPFYMGTAPASSITGGLYTSDTAYVGALNLQNTPATFTGFSQSSNVISFKSSNSTITTFNNTSNYWQTDRANANTTGRFDFQYNHIKPSPASNSTAQLGVYRAGVNYNSGADTATIPGRLTGSYIRAFYEDSTSFSTGGYRHIPPLYRAFESAVGDNRWHTILGKSYFGVPNSVASLPYGVNIWKSIAIHKDSLPLITAAGTRHMLVVDTTGNYQLMRMEVPSGGGGSSYTFQHSLTESGGDVNLVNDQASPGNSKLYGTDGSGVKGWYDQPAGGGSSYTFSTGLTEAAGTVTNNVSTGVSGGQTINGGTGSGENLTLSSTTNATKGDVIVTGDLIPTTTGVYYNGIATNRWAGMSVNGINLNTGGTPSANTISVNAGFHITLGSTPSASGANIFNYQSASSAATSGTTNLINISTAPFQPTSGDAVYNVLSITNTINQTGTATGITRGVLIWPTLTSAVNYRAIETIGKIRFNGLADVTTPDSLLAYEDGEVKKVAASSITATSTYELFYSDNSSTTVANTTSETTLLGTGAGTAEYSNITAGSVLRLQGGGIISTDATPGVPEFNFSISNYTLGMNLTGLTGGITNINYDYVFEIIPVATGTSQDAMINCKVSVYESSTTVKTFTFSQRATGAFTTVGTPAADVSVQWDAADADNSVTAHKNTIEIFRK